MGEEHKGYSVTCPWCGRVNQKTFKTDSFIKCNKCKAEFYAYISIDSGSGLFVYASSPEGTDPRQRLIAYAKAITKVKEDCHATT